MTIAEAAKIIGIGRNTAYEAASSGQLPTVLIGKRLRVSRAGLLKFICESGAHARIEQA